MSSSATSYNYKECKSCHLPLNDGQAYKLGTDQWHVSCFKCSKCSKPLGVDSNFLVLGTGALVCSDCSYTCKSCNKKIYDLAILTGDLAYCADCFKCKSCNKPIDDLKYARTSKGLFCMPCHNMLMEKKKKYEKIKKLKAEKEKEILDKANKRLIEQKAQRKSSLQSLNSKQEPPLPQPPQSLPSPPLPPPPQQEQQRKQRQLPTTTTNENETLELNRQFEKPPIPLNNERNSSIGSKQSSTYSHAANSSTSTFDLDDYADSSNTKDDEVGSSIYSKTGVSTGTVDSKGEQASSNINSSLEILESANSSPAQKLDVVLDHDVSSPGTAKIQQTPTFEDNNTNNYSFSKSTPVNIPNLQPNLNNRFSFLTSDNGNSDSDSDIGIPLRSPKRNALSPVRNTAQFRTPELSTPKKKSSPSTLMSPSSIHRQAHIFDDTEIEKEPESFINLDETEEESIVSRENDFESIKDVSDSKLLSPIKYNMNSFDTSGENSGLNIKGVDLSGPSNDNVISMKGNTSDNTTTHGITSTSVTNSQSSFDSNDKMTPNSKKKPIGGLGRSLTKVFGRGRKPSNDFQGQIVSPNMNNGDYPATPETITSRKSSVITNNLNNTPKKHARTQSDHSFVAFTTPPVPHVGHHSRSISETTTFAQPDVIQQTTNELQLLKTEINSLTLTKATILRDIQNLRTQMKSLELDISDKQNILKDLDSSILFKQKLASTDELSVSNNSTTSLKNSSKDELTNLKISSTEYVYEESQTMKAVDINSGQQAATPPSTTSITTSVPPYNTFNPYSQPNSSTSQGKDKRTGFMRRIFGTHSNLNSANSVGPNNNNNNNSTPIGSGNISQPMNVRHNDESSTYADLTNKNLNNNNNESTVVNSGIKSSRSANFMQWRSANNNSNKSNAITNSSENLLYNMTLQELVNSEGSNGVPFIIKTCINEVERRGLKIEGIYRISASTSTIEKLEHFFESLDINNVNDINKMHSLIDTGDIHAMAGLLKRYLKKIPDSVIPQELYDSFISVSKLENDEKRIERLTQIITSLPKANKSTLFILSKHLSLIADNEKFNKMNSASLATVFAPTLVRHNTLHPTQEIHDNKNKTSVTELLFKNYIKIFV